MTYSKTTYTVNLSSFLVGKNLSATPKSIYFTKPENHEEIHKFLEFGSEFRNKRISQSDMITTEEAAELTATTRMTINTWIKTNKCIGIKHIRRGFKLPKWQFEDENFFRMIPSLFKALDTQDGWAVLSFLENKHAALSGKTPLEAIRQGENLDKILNLAVAEGF